MVVEVAPASGGVGSVRGHSHDLGTRLSLEQMTGDQSVCPGRSNLQLAHTRKYFQLYEREFPACNQNDIKIINTTTNFWLRIWK